MIALIQAAVIHAQSQPWMYEVLALSMEIDGRPREEIERVVLSLTDFGVANFGTMTYSAAYLVRLGRDAAGLRLYREASRMLPEQPEPYVLGLPLARKLGDVEGIEWAAAGILQYAWTKDHATLHRQAENAAAEAIQSIEKSGDKSRAEQLRQTVAAARVRDLTVRLAWSGVGDLDLLVEEPGRSVCSFEQRETAGGGILLHDGYGPAPENCYESYVCVLGQSGEYRLRIRHAWGEIVGRRATLTVIRHQGSAAEIVETHPVVLGSEEVVIRVQLDDGRRKSLRSVTTQEVSAGLQTPPPRQLRAGLPPKVRQAADEFEQSRAEQERLQIRRVGAVAFQPIIQVIPDGTTFSAQAIVSPDRRYVRIGVNPSFTSITDVFTFTFFGGATGGGQQPGAGN